ncbi:hypothetical protein PGB90_005698 [Kerria lacca]
MEEDLLLQQCVLPKKLSNVSFEDLNNLRSECGVKIYNKIISGNKNISKCKYRRENKNRPRERSSKIPPFKNKIPIKKEEHLDPRFHDTFGSFDRAIFEKNYKFLDKLKKKERKLLNKKLMDPELDERDRFEIKLALQKIENQKKNKSLQKEKDKLKNEQKAYKLKELKEGRNPQYCKRTDEKLLHLVRQFETLKERGGLQKHIKRRRKKILQKDKKQLNFSI